MSKITAALHQLQERVHKVGKGSENAHFGSKYANLEAIEAAIRGHMRDLDIACFHYLAPSASGDGWDVVTRLTVEDETEEFRFPAGRDTNPHKLGSASTYGRRYTMQGLARLVPSDDDGNAAADVPVFDSHDDSWPNESRKFLGALDELGFSYDDAVDHLLAAGIKKRPSQIGRSGRLKLYQQLKASKPERDTPIPTSG